MSIRTPSLLLPLRPLLEEVGRLLRISTPSVLTGFGWMAMGLVDTLMVGRLGTAELAATAMANSLYFTIFVGFIGLIDALTPLISQALGAGHRRRAGLLLWQGIFLSLVCGPLLALVYRNAGGLLGYLGQAPEVVEGGSAYLAARALGVVPQTLFGAHRAFLNGIERTSRVFRIVLLANGINLVANQVLIFGWGPVPALGIAGAGYATALSVTALFLGAALEVHRGGYAEFGVAPRRPDPELLRQVVRLGWPMSAQYTLEVSVFSLISVCVGWMGPAVLSAHQVACSITSLAFVVAQGFATGATVRVGEAFGAGDPRGATQSGRVSMALSGLCMAVVGMLLLGMPRTLAGVYTSDPAVLDQAAGVLWIAAVMALFDGVQIVAGAALRATSDSRTPFLAHMVGYWALGVPVGYWLAFPMGYGLAGFWWGLVLALGSISLVLAGLFLQGRWVERVPAPLATP